MFYTNEFFLNIIQQEQSASKQPCNLLLNMVDENRVHCVAQYTEQNLSERPTLRKNKPELKQRKTRTPQKRVNKKVEKSIKPRRCFTHSGFI